jgi:threonine synthase
MTIDQHRQPVLEIACTNCGRAYPTEGFPSSCPVCGGLYDFKGQPCFDRGGIDPAAPGIWRYRQMFGLPQEVEVVSLGEGNTPLVWADAFGREVAFKCEFLNPTGSFKDRGSALIIAMLKARGVSEAVEDSSGNAGASCAAYAARAGIKVSIFIDPAGAQVRASKDAGADAVEINTGAYADAAPADRPARLQQVRTAVREAAQAGLEVLAGHGLTYVNVRPIAAISDIVELNIGHSIVSRAVLVGFDRAVREMMALLA